MMISNLSIIEENVLSVIPRGQDNKKTLKILSEPLGLNPREFQSVINTLICNHGIPIVAIRRGGVYIPLSESEKQDGLQGLKNQTTDQLKRIRIVEKINVEEWNQKKGQAFAQKVGKNNGN